MKTKQLLIFMLSVAMILASLQGIIVSAEEAVDLTSDLEFYYSFNDKDVLAGSGANSEELVSMEDSFEKKTEAPVTEEFGGYIEFEEEGMDYIFAPEGMLDGFKDELTISMWVKPSKYLPWQRLFDFGQGGVYLMVTLWPEGDGGRVSLVYALDGTNNQVNLYQEGLQTLNVNQWHHVAVTVGGGVMTLYVDGVNIVSGAIPSDLSIFDGALEHYIGKSRYAQDPLYEGSMDEIRIYKRTLNVAEITALASGRLDAPVVDTTPEPTVEPTETPTEAPTETPASTATQEAPSASATTEATATTQSTDVDATPGNNGWIIWVVIGAVVVIVIVIVVIVAKKKKG